VGSLMFFYSVLGLFLATVDRLGPSVASLQEAFIAVEHIEEIREVPQENNGAGLKFGPSDHCASIVFDHVSFWYRPAFPVLSDINLELHAGETIAVLGSTGSGKSTLLSLINGLYQVQAGTLLINGRNVRDMDTVSLRGRIAIVLQDPGLVNGSIRDNIAIGTREASREAIERAARQAYAHDFITALPRGYDYEVGPGGTGLSCGQRQRVALARAFLRNPSVLILDEATSNLDPETERQIIDALQLGERRRMTILATHRLALAGRADRIVVLDQGRIIESGTHAELFARRGKYYAMWEAMSSTQSPSTFSEANDGALEATARTDVTPAVGGAAA